MITKQEIENCRPGECVNPSCRTFARQRNTAGECLDCHGEGMIRRAAQDEDDNRRRKAEGLKFWADRGVKVGDKMKTTVVSIFGLQAETVYGIAKVSVKYGAYVKAGKLLGNPHAWVKLEKAA